MPNVLKIYVIYNSDILHRLSSKFYLGVPVEMKPDFLDGIVASLQDMEAVKHDGRVREDR